MAVKNDLTVNSIKMLAIDMINKAGSGHPGVVFSSAPILYALYMYQLNITANNPTWINRDRFILSNGHASAALYSTLYHAGFNYSVEDLKRFRDIDSYTPGHPELNVELGIECSTGLLGQGVASAVGIALGERYLESICKSVNKKSKLIDFNTFVLCGDGDMEEGITYEALSFAGTQKLNKLTVIYDSNKMQIDGEVDNTFIDNMEDRFASIGFEVINVKNGHNVSDIVDALDEAVKNDAPTLIIVNTKIGYGTSLEGTNAAHSKLLDEEEINDLKQKAKLNTEPFMVSDAIKNNMSDSIIKRVAKKYENWLKEYDLARQSQDSSILSLINLLEKDEFEIDFDSTNYKINENYCEEGRVSNCKVMNFIAPKTHFFLGGSADLAVSTKAVIDKSGLMSDDNPSGRNIAFGVREVAMAAILNGLSLLNIRTFGSTFLTFADYLKPSMRMSAMMNLPVTYIFTHDSVSVGFDGASHEPIEQLTMLRSIPNMLVFRPADINEIIGSWEYILKNKGPACIVLSKEKINILRHTNGKYVQYGAYIVRKEKYRLDGVIIATGSEVTTAIKIAEELFTGGIDLRVVSMPSMELFEKQNPLYEEKLLPKDVKIITLEAGSNKLWYRFASNKESAIGINMFGASGTKDDVLKYCEFDYNSLLIRIKKMFESN
ncbi:MAG: transketolase [Bacilli bacterium]|nr:transketolase [Bacilli bacterium]